MKNNNKSGKISTKKKIKVIKREEDNNKCSWNKIFNLIFWGLFIVVFLFSIHLLECKIHDVEISSTKNRFLIALLFIYFSLFLLLTKKDYGKNIFDFILRFSSIILLLTIATLFTNIYLIMNKTFLYCILLLLFTTIWIAINKSSDFKIVKFGNSIVAVVLAIFLYINGFIWTILKVKGTCQTTDFIIKGVEMSYEQVVNIILFPLFFMTAICGLYFSYRSFRLEQQEKTK